MEKSLWRLFPCVRLNLRIRARQRQVDPPLVHEGELVATIHERQNSDWCLKLLAAQRQLYSEAKALRRWRTWSAAAVMIIGLIVSAFIPGVLTIVGVAGGILAVPERLIAALEGHCTKMAANIQEQFDTFVFPLTWNQIVVGRKVDAEEIDAAQARFSASREELHDWYSPTEGLPHPLDILACQRTNLRWDNHLRLRYARGLTVALGCLALATLAIGIARNLNLLSFVLAYLPSLPAFLAGIDAAQAHHRHASEQLELKEMVEELWESGRHDLRNVKVSDCRIIQDSIYRLRVCAPPIPDWWYWRYRSQFEKGAKQAVDKMKQDLDLSGGA